MDEVGDGTGCLLWIGVLAALAAMDGLLIGKLLVVLAGWAWGGG